MSDVELRSTIYYKGVAYSSLERCFRVSKPWITGFASMRGSEILSIKKILFVGRPWRTRLQK